MHDRGNDTRRPTTSQMTLGFYNEFSPEEREAVGKWKRWAVKHGLYVYPAQCVACGASGGIVDGHWEDYSPPYSQDKDIPLCYRCHMFVHCRLRFPEAWNRYRSEIREGWRYPVMATRSFQQFMAETISKAETIAKKQGPLPTRLWLDEIHECRLCPPGRRAGNWKPAKMPKLKRGRDGYDVPPTSQDEQLAPLSREARERLVAIRHKLEDVAQQRHGLEPDCVVEDTPTVADQLVDEREHETE